MTTIFISHFSHDDAFALQLCDDLRLVGHTPWIDKIEIQPGQSIISSIQNGITKSRYAIVILSNMSIQSRWVDTEWKEKFWDALTNQHIRVIPILRENCDIPLFLKTLRYADFSKSYATGFATLCLALRPVRSQVPDILDIDFLHAIEYTARTSNEDHVRLACAHTIWSFRPDRFKPIL